MKVLEDEHHRVARREALEEQPPAGEQVGAVRRHPVLEAQQERQAGLDQPALALVGHVLADRGVELLPARSGSSSSTIPIRERIISASAQKATPSP